MATGASTHMGRAQPGGRSAAAAAPAASRDALQSRNSREIACNLRLDDGEAATAGDEFSSPLSSLDAPLPHHPAPLPPASTGAALGGAGGYVPRMASLAEQQSDPDVGGPDGADQDGRNDDVMSPFGALAAAPATIQDTGGEPPMLGPSAAGKPAGGKGDPSGTAGGGGGGDDGGMYRTGSVVAGAPSSGRRKRRLVSVRRVMRDAYEYHGLNGLFVFFLFAILTNFVLYFHWTNTTAVFKNTVQYSFKSYGNPDWQGQSLVNVDTMNDGVEYIGGWLQFWIQRSMAVDWPRARPAFPGDQVRVGEYGDVVFARLLVNLENNCNHGTLACWKADEADVTPNGPRTLLERGWRNVGPKDYQMSTQASSLKARTTGKEKPSDWFSFVVVAPKLGTNNGTRVQYLRRLFSGFTSDTSLNYDDSATNEALAQACPDAANGTLLSLDDATQEASCTPGGKGSGIKTLEDLKPYIARNAFAVVLEVLAVDVMSTKEAPDMALFSMNVQRSDIPSNTPDRAMWQITTTLPVRRSFYTLRPWDYVRAGLEVLLLLCVATVLSAQVWQYRVSKWQHGRVGVFFKQPWNIFELLSTLALCLWIILYVVLAIVLSRLAPSWRPEDWNSVGGATDSQLRSMTSFAYWYNLWLFGGILVNSLVCLRILRYMRIHPGLKAFYQVFVIAAREFLDFAVFLVYILLLLGSAIFAFFQLTGGNNQFVRFSDGLSVMTRLTFGFLSYEDFQNQALGLGSAVSAVTLFFWFGVLLLVVFSQNIILAIVAEAYEEAKVLLGTANTSFVVLIFLRVVFLFVLASFKVRRVWSALASGLRGARPSAASAAAAAALGGRGGGSGGGGAGAGGGCGGEDPLAWQLTYQESIYISARNGILGSSGSSMTGRLRALGSGGFAAAAAAHEAAAKDVEAAQGLSLKRVVTMAATAATDIEQDEKMYREMMSMAQKTLRGSWGSWARRYWAPWAVVRTPGVRSLMALYQDFASYKIKTLPPWIGAAEAAQRVRLQSAASGSAALTETDDGQAQLPDLSDGGVLGADELIALLQVALEMGRTPMIWRSPFAGLRETSIPVLAQAILAVYGHDDENDGDENAQPPPPGADGDGDGDGDSGAPPQGAGLAPTASGLAPLPSGAVAGPVVKTKDLRLGSMGERRGAGGFVGRLAELRRGSDALAQGGRALFGGGGGGGRDNEHHGAPGAHGGGVGNQMRAMMREQRRLEDQIVQANRSTQTLGDTINRQLAAQKRVMVDHNRQVAELAGVLKSLADAAGITGAAAAPAAVPGSGALGSRATLGGGSLSVAGGTSLPQAKTGGWKRSTFGTRHLTSATAAEAAAASAVPEDPSAPTAAGVASGGSVGAPPPAGGPRLLPVPGAGGEAEIAGLRQRLDEQQKLLEAMMELLKK